MTTGHVVTDGVISMALVKPLMTLAVFFLDTFDKIVNHWSRIREFAADQVGIQTSGADASASALLRTSICAAVIDEVLNDAWEHPEAPTADLLAEMLQKAHENGLDDPQKHMEDMQPHPTDTHPPTRQRLEAMGQTYADTAFIETVVRKPEMAHSALTGLLPEPESLCRRLTEAFHSSAQQYQAEVDAALEEAIAKADEPPFALFERTWHLVTLMLGIAVIMFLVGIFSSMATGGKIIVMILGVVFLWGAWHYYKIGRNQPRVILTAGGFGSPSLAREVPWTDIEDYEIATSSGNTNTTTIKLMLHEKTVPPEPVKGIPGCKYNRKRHALSIMLHSLKKIEGKHVTGERIADELGKRLQAGHARVLLAERKKNRE